MKKTLIVLSMAVWAMVSCTPESKPQETPAADPIKDGITAKIATTTLDGANTLVWNGGEDFSYFSGEILNEKFTLVSGDGSKDGQFIAQGIAENWGDLDIAVAIVPFNGAANVTWGKSIFVDCSIQATQNMTEYGKYPSAPMVAVGPKNAASLDFQACAGAVAVKITGTASVAKVIFKSNDKANINGDFEVAVSELSEIRSVTPGAKGTGETVLECANGIQLSENAKEFAIFAPAGLYANGFTVEVVDTDGEGNTYEFNGMVTVKTGRRVVIGEIAYAPKPKPNLVCTTAGWTDLEFPVVDIKKDGSVYTLANFLNTPATLILTVNADNSISVDVTPSGWKYNYSSAKFMYFTNWSTYLPVQTLDGTDILFCGLWYDGTSYFDPSENCFVLRFQISKNTSLAVGTSGTNVLFKLYLDR